MRRIDSSTSGRASPGSLAGGHPRPRVRPARPARPASSDRISRAYRSGRTGARRADQPTWLEGLAEPDRVSFRERSRALVAVLIEHLDETDPATRALRLQEASRLAADHGRQVAELGLSMSEAVEEFLRFRTPFVAELARVAGRRGLDAREATGLLTDADAAIDRLLVAMMTGHSLVRGRGRGRSAARAGSAGDDLQAGA